MVVERSPFRSFVADYLIYIIFKHSRLIIFHIYVVVNIALKVSQQLDRLLFNCIPTEATKMFSLSSRSRCYAGLRARVEHRPRTAIYRTNKCLTQTTTRYQYKYRGVKHHHKQYSLELLKSDMKIIFYKLINVLPVERAPISSSFHYTFSTSHRHHPTHFPSTRQSEVSRHPRLRTLVSLHADARLLPHTFL